MTRYRSFKYGAEKYGVSPASDTLSWSLDIDWDNDGLFDGFNDAYRMTKLKVRRGRSFFLKSGGDGFEPVRDGEFTATMRNDDGRYDPYNTGSPLYPNVLPGAKFRLRVKDNATGTIYPLIAGRISDIRPLAGGGEWVTISGVDQARWLREQKVTGGLQENINLSDAIDAVLDLAGWTDGRALDSSTETMLFWWPAGRSALSEISDLADASLGTFYVDAQGNAAFRSRHNLQASLLTLDETDIEIGILLPQPWEVVRNAIKAIAYPRVLSGQGELWKLQDKPYLGAGQSLTVWAGYRYESQEVPAKNVIQPVANTDYTANTATDGSGIDLTGQFSVAMTAFASSAQLVITNNAASPGYLTLLKLRGDPVISTPVTLEAERANSIARYQRRSFVLSSRWLQSTNVAMEFVSFLVSFLSSARAFPKIQLRANPSRQFALDLFDRVDLNFPSKSVAGTFVVGSIVHEWQNATGQVVLSTVQFEPLADLSEYWTFPASIGVNSVFAF